MNNLALQNARDYFCVYLLNFIRMNVEFNIQSTVLFDKILLTFLIGTITFSPQIIFPFFDTR